MYAHNAKDHRREDGCYPQRQSSASAPRIAGSLQGRWVKRRREPWPWRGGLPSLWITKLATPPEDQRAGSEVLIGVPCAPCDASASPAGRPPELSWASALKYNSPDPSAIHNVLRGGGGPPDLPSEGRPSFPARSGLISRA